MKKIIKVILGIVILLILFFFAINTFIYNYMYPMQYKEYILKYSEEYNIDPYLVYAIINVESNFNPTVKSEADAKGLMQIMDITADWAKEHIDLDEKEIDYYKPETNIKIGCWYLSKLSSMFDGNIIEIIAAYNAGSGNVTGWISDGRDIASGDIPFEETKKYVEKVLSNIDIYHVLYGDSYSKDDVYNASVKIIDMVYTKIMNRTNKLMSDK